MKKLLLLIAMAAAAAQQPTPQLSISANGTRSVDLSRGWPLLVRLVVLHSQRTSRAPDIPSLRLAPPGMTWADAITFQIAPEAGGTPASLAFTLTAPPEDPVVTLGNRMMANAVWRVSPEATLVLQKGTYTLTARLEIKNSDGWNGIAQSAPVTIRVADESLPLPPEEETSMLRLRSQYEMAAGNAAEAERLLDQILKTGPKDTAALAAKAQLLEFRSELAMAYMYVHQALLAAHEKDPHPEEPPRELLELARRLRARLMNDQ